MEISKSLQEEIRSVQNKLKNAIQNHQVYVRKLNDDPNNEELHDRIREIQEHIISLSKCQKLVVQRLRKEVKLYEAANSNGTKVSMGSLLGLNNNNNITNNNETKTNESEQTINNLNGLCRRSSKDDYEDGIQNVSPSPEDNDSQNNFTKSRTRLDEIDSNDEDVIEISIEKDSIEKNDADQIIDIQLCEKMDFLGCLGLITSDKHTEIQNKRAERKRRSTANPQFVYSNWEIPTKRKRHSYLQSNGTAPQTRQTTARLNGPSPPPPNKIGGISKPSSPLSKTTVKSLIPTQKSSTRPNILRNNQDSKIFSGKIKTSENCSSGQSETTNVKSIQSVGSKVVHIPGLPSSLTIERIENDSSTVCIHCRNPGSLTVCDICESNYHLSCQPAGFTSSKKCSNCEVKEKERDRDRDNGGTLVTEFKQEKEDEIATTSDASGIVGKTGEDAEVDKTSCGFHKVDAEERSIPAAIDINQLPSSTFFIPLASISSIPSPFSAPATIDISQSETVASTPVSIGRESNVGTSCSAILANQLSQSSTVHPDTQHSYTSQLPVSGVQPEKPQSFLIVKTITESPGVTGRNKQSSSSSIVSRSQPERRSSSSIFDYQQFSSTGYNDHDQSEIRYISDNPVSVLGESSGGFKHNGQGFDSAEDKTSKPSKSDTAKSFNGDKHIPKLHSKLSINQFRPSRQSNSFIPLHSIINSSETLDQSDISKESEGSKVRQSSAATSKNKSKTNLLYSLFSSNNESNPFPGCFIQPQNPSTEQQVQSEFEQCSPENCQSKYDESESRIHSSSCSNVAEYVKLEEAHLPAPLRPNLGTKCIEEVHTVLEKKEDSSSRQGKSRTNHLLKRGSQIAVVQSKTADVSDVNNDQGDTNSDFTSFEDYHNKNLRATLDFIARERKHSNNYIKIHDFEEYEDACEKHLSNVHSIDTMKQNSRTSTSKLLHKNCPVLRSRLLASENKAEFERQDLPINDLELIEEQVIDNEAKEFTDKNATLSEEESKAKLGINVASTENMQVLEQFESAMLEADED